MVEDLKYLAQLKRLKAIDACKQLDDVNEYAKELKELVRNIDRHELEKLTKLLKALADQNRLLILKLLCIKEMCNCELTIALPLTQPTISHHISILERAHLIQSRNTGKWTFYSLTKIGEIIFQFLENNFFNFANSY
ncbi:MAG: ArsR/SmtB family transcription factor [Candidatus Helarchaeota archaeon]